MIQFAAGFGKGGTSLPFWEEVYGFNMSCVGKELVGAAAKIPIVDVLDKSDIVTDTASLQVCVVYESFAVHSFINLGYLY